MQLSHHKKKKKWPKQIVKNLKTPVLLDSLKQFI